MEKNLFLSNQSEIRFIEHLKDNLNSCTEFCFSVSFIKKAGLVLFSNELENALKRGTRARLITSTYQNFTDISSLEYLYSLANIYPNFQCHIDDECFGDNGFHSKGYLFVFDDCYEFMVGSTNITRFALLKNVEWNVSLQTKEKDSVYNDAMKEFDDLWDQTYSLDKERIEIYKSKLDYAIEKWDMDYFDSGSTIKPNYMQRKALKELRRYRDMGASKALVVSATASGKTYLAAFDARNFGSKHLLFIVHRDTILRDARETFMKVFGSDYLYGLFTGTEKNYDGDFVFATNITMASHLTEFDPHEFDYIVLDECHHAVTDTYQKIMNYFKPDFLLGLTATPERMDNEDVFELFDKNVPYELRLRDAICNDLVVPFKYYGIRNCLIDYSDANKDQLLKQLSSDENCEFIAKEIMNHLPPNGKLKGLVFCRTIQHAKEMAQCMSQFGFVTQSLIGSDNTGSRIKAYKDLQDENHPLQLLFVVDIANEGIDIPAINLVVFLRPTESSTVFIQQLGRGLRKVENKPYLTVLDFIGNSYKRSVQIAMALGSLSLSNYVEKKLLVQLIQDDFSSLEIPNVEIHIDEESKEEILSYIEKTNFNTLDILKQDYYNFKRFIGSETYPKQTDFLNSDVAPDLMRMLKSKGKGTKNVSYYNFLSKVDEEVPELSDNNKQTIEKISNFLPLVRKDEYLLLKQIINGTRTKEQLLAVEKEYNAQFDETVMNHALYILEKQNIICNDASGYSLCDKKLSSYCMDFIEDTIEYGISRYDNEFGNYDGVFKLYASYYKEQIMMILKQNGLMFMKGTKIENDGTIYIFAALKKDANIEERLNYADKFISKNVFQWECENNVTMGNTIGQKLIHSKLAHVFIRKMESEDGITLPFTYIGTGVLTNPRVSNNPEKSLIFDIPLDNEIPDYLMYDFKVPEVKTI